MGYTLLLIYSVGLGNIAVMTEKFDTITECEEIKKDIKTQLQDDVKFIKCYRKII